MKILLVEDEPEMAQSISHSLTQEKYVVENAYTLQAALEKIHIYEYDCILLDISLPGGSGLTLLKELQKINKTEGVIIISAKNSLDDKIEGLNLGADDYLPKPFHLAELHARLKSVLRRKKFEGTNLLTLANTTIDLQNRMVFIDEKEIVLNRKEYDILLYFVSNKNRLVSKTSLAEHIWGDRIDEADSFEFIYSQIKNLRKKLQDNGARISLVAVYGLGYKLVTE
ncbi:response regulator transcription factor [Rhodocytophaga aerolata]|uniref:Response regulator transcription factor n=1 Tax=Rhodocytophaga aerolata TaxID=455078 RepID=A0ABT8RFC9_9BACT|nr:response regulator transcription factor [Rhodocytophaga aerolata]MDO1449427.1 response regulator transcription factor [Rhodocytophaga aerolata]